MEVQLDKEQIQSMLDEHTRKVDSIIDKYSGKKELLISLLQDLQTEFNYLPKDVLVMVSNKLCIPLSQVFSVATFFKSFTLEPTGRHKVTICMGTACHVRGAQRLTDKIGRDFNLKPGHTTEDNRFTLETVNCLGCCALGPVVVVDNKYESKVNSEKLNSILKKYE